MIFCPHCGKNEARIQNGNGKYFAFCPNCFASAAACDSRDEAQEAWDRRALPRFLHDDISRLAEDVHWVLCGSLEDETAAERVRLWLEQIQAA